MKKFVAGLVEVAAGAVCIVIPEPTTTAGGVVLVMDGLKRIVESIDN